MASRADILARMGLDNTGFKNGMRRSESFAKKSVGRMMRMFAPLIGLAGIGGASRSAAQLADDLSDLATIANTNIEQFQRLAAGAEQYGVKQEKLAKVLNNVNRNIGQFVQTGKGPLIDFFENIAPLVDLTADSFRDLSGPDALQLYYNALEQAGVPQSEMIFYLEQLSTRSSKLIPLLRDGGAEFKRLGDQAEAAGAVMNENTRASLERTADRITRMKRVLTVLWGEILVKVVPVFQIMGQGLGFLGDIVGATAAVFVNFGKVLGDVVTAAVKPAITAFSVLAKAGYASFEAINGNFGTAKQLLIEAKNEFVEIGDEIKAIPGAMKTAFDEIGQTAKTAVDTIGDQVEERNKKIESSIGELTGKADAEAEKIRKEREALEKEINRVTGGNGAGNESSNEPATYTSQGNADESTEMDSPAGKNSGRLSDGTRYETFAGPNKKRQKVYFKNGRKLGTAEDQEFRSQRFGQSSVAGVPDAQSRMKAKSAAEANMSSNNHLWKDDITKIREKLDAIDVAVSSN